jgi:DNA-directed RNA polymerase subunit M/transcription elongation factor TFIIS
VSFLSQGYGSRWLPRRSHEIDVVSVPRLPQSVVPPKRLFLLSMSRVRQTQSIHGRERGHQAAMRFVLERVALSHDGHFRKMAGEIWLGQALPLGYRVIVNKYEQAEAASPEPVDPSDHCPFCQGIDIVNDGYREHIITATATLFYYCCACAHSWHFVAPYPRHSAPVRLTPTRDRRRSA